ncbi:MAG: oligosaccharide flippase family protein [Chloracidobacterium sp.]|nr:oligosaccharide flippase family protein [Chloracidobacterium sp.]
MTTKVVKGSLWTLAGQVAPLGVSLFTTPFVIRLLGSEGYGVLILVGLIPTYFAFADFGMGIASTKFASEAYAAGDSEKEARTVRTAALIALIVSLPVAAAIFIFSNAAIAAFNVPAHLQTRSEPRTQTRFRHLCHWVSEKYFQHTAAHAAADGSEYIRQFRFSYAWAYRHADRYLPRRRHTRRGRHTAHRRPTNPRRPPLRLRQTSKPTLPIHPR